MLIDRLKEIPVGHERIEQVTALGGLVVDRARGWARHRLTRCVLCGAGS